MASSVSLARATLVALRDDYLGSGAVTLAVRSLARHYLVALPALLAVAFLVVLWRRRARRLPMRLVAWGVTALLAYLFVAGRFPVLPYHAPGFDSDRALAAHAGAAVVALVAASCLGRFVGERRLARKPLGALGVLALVVAIAAAFWAAPAGARWPERPNVILISLDTLRADRLGCYGYPRETTPELDRFAERAVRFETAYAPMPWTLTSHMSLLTSLSPTEHGVREDRGLSLGVPTLADLFQAADYETAALVDVVPWLSRSYGFARGFQTFRDVYGDAERKQRLLAPLLDDLQNGPFFLFLHYFDAHSDIATLPYESTPEDLELFAGWYDGDFEERYLRAGHASKLLVAADRGEVPVNEEEGRWIGDLYDAGVRSMDRMLGGLFEELEARGLLENSIILVTADHGEELADHGGFLHNSLFEECLHVPLLVRTPETSRAVGRGLVALVDVPATLLELAGLERTEVGGQSFADVIRGSAERASREQVFFDSGGPHLGLRRGRWKLIGPVNDRLLFDLEADPGELENLLDQGAPPGLVEELTAILTAELARMRANHARKQPPVELPPQEEERARLHALGYVGE